MRLRTRSKLSDFWSMNKMRLHSVARCNRMLHASTCFVSYVHNLAHYTSFLGQYWAIDGIALPSAG